MKPSSNSWKKTDGDFEYVSGATLRANAEKLKKRLAGMKRPYPWEGTSKTGADYGKRAVKALNSLKK